MTFTYQTGSVQTADPVLIDGFVKTELARACVDIREYTPNLRIEFQGVEVITSLDPPCLSLERSSPGPSVSFWNVLALGSFRYDTTNKIAGNFTQNVLLVYQWTVEANRLDWNDGHPYLQITDNLDCSRRVTLHELGHAFGLEDKKEEQYKGVMSKKDVFLGLSPENLKFEDFELRLIQSKSKPD